MKVRLAGAVLACALLAGCGSSDAEEPSAQAADDSTPDGGGRIDDVMGELEGLTPDEREARLLEMVDEEGGTVTLYTSMAPDVAETVVAAFEDRFEVDVSVFRSDSEGVALRVQQEGDAGFVGADVVEAGALPLAGLEPDLFADYESPFVDALVDGSDQGHWIAGSLDVFALSWNTDSVDEAERPRSWSDLADPKWKGRLALEVGDVEWYLEIRKHFVEQGMSEEEADDLFAAMGSNAKILDGHTLMAQLLASGEFDVAASNFVHHLEGLMDEGAPVAYEPIVGPMVGRPSGLALLRGTENPAAAVLLTDWLLDDGQEVLLEAGLRPTRADLQDSADAELVIADFDELWRNFDELSTRYQQIVSEGEVVEDPDDD